MADFLNRYGAGAGLLALVILFSPLRAHADTMGASPLLEASVLLSGSESTVYSMDAPSAGTLSIKLSDLVWPDPLSNLSVSVMTPSNVLMPLTGAGDFTVAVGSAGAYYARVTGQAAGALDLGLYSLQVMFTPAISTVPVPPAARLLLSGLFGIGWLLWRRNESVTCRA